MAASGLFSVSKYSSRNLIMISRKTSLRRLSGLKRSQIFADLQVILFSQSINSACYARVYLGFSEE